MEFVTRIDDQPVTSIEIDVGLHQRVRGLDTKHVNKIVASLTVEARIKKPLITMNVDDHVMLVDGFHRMQAISVYNMKHQSRRPVLYVPVEMWHGTYTEAIELAYMNTDHLAVPVTDDERRELLWKALTDQRTDTFRKMSVRSLPAYFSISKSSVGRTIKKLRDDFGGGDIDRGAAIVARDYPNLKWPGADAVRRVNRDRSAVHQARIDGKREGKRGVQDKIDAHTGSSQYDEESLNRDAARALGEVGEWLKLGLLSPQELFAMANA